MTIGVPEGTVAGTDLGIRQYAASFSREGLTQLDFDGRVLPRLAERWTWDNEGRRLRLRLREDVQFHDGTPVTSELMADVLRDAILRDSNRAQHPSLDFVTVVRADPRLELVIELSEPSTFLLEDLELPLGIGPQNGTGAFTISTMNDSEVELASFAHYYLGAPQIQKVTLRSFPTLRTAWTSLLRGDIDMVTNVPSDAVEFVQNDEVQVTSFARRYQFLIAFNSKKSPFNSSLVRRALNLALNRDALIDNVLQGHGVAASGPLWPQHWAFDKAISSFSFDPMLAASLIENAGFHLDKSVDASSLPARLRFTCLIPKGYSVLERVALETQRQLYSVGVDIQFEEIPIEQYTARILNGNFEAALIDMISGPSLGRPYIFWRSAKHFKGLNVFGYENEEAEKLFNVLRLSTNEGAVRSATSRLQRVLLDDPPALFLAWNQGTRAIRRDFGIPEEPGRDPLYMISRSKPMTNLESASAR